MDTATYNTLHAAIVAFDMKQAARPGYDRYALPDYIKRLQEIRADVVRGRTLRMAIIVGFRGRLQTALLRSVGELPATPKEKLGLYVYTPMK